jgi:hypothetical protein
MILIVTTTTWGANKEYFFLELTRKSRDARVSKNFNTQTSENDTFACEIHTKTCRCLKRFSVISTQNDWFRHARLWFLHVECKFNTHECNFHTYESDLYTHECDYDTNEFDFHTLSVISIRSVILTLIGLKTTLMIIIMTRQSVMKIRTSVILTR